MTQKRRMPVREKVFAYWQDLGYCGFSDECMGCGSREKLERCHNLVLLCHYCHVGTDGYTKEEWNKFLLTEDEEFINRKKRQMFTGNFLHCEPLYLGFREYH